MAPSPMSPYEPISNPSVFQGGYRHQQPASYGRNPWETHFGTPSSLGEVSLGGSVHRGSGPSEQTAVSLGGPGPPVGEPTRQITMVGPRGVASYRDSVVPGNQEPGYSYPIVIPTFAGGYRGDIVEQVVQQLRMSTAGNNSTHLVAQQAPPPAAVHLAPHPGLARSATTTALAPLPFAGPEDHLAAFFPSGIGTRSPYTDSEILKISSLLKLSNVSWSKVPRTYIVLRTIGHSALLDDLIALGLSDHWFPVTSKSLPQILSPTIRADFVRAQDLVLTKSMDLEMGEHGRHQNFSRGEHIPFETKSVLGSGGFGQVDRVISLISYKEYARKRIRRRAMFGNAAAEATNRFIAEVEILKRLKHRHMVEFVGSYTDPTYLALIVSPVAEMDLAVYLQRVTAEKNPELRTFFGCLATALQYLHEHQIRHKDIKPGNVLVHRGSILLTDFGLSRDSTDLTGSTTSGTTALSPRYCAPEVAAHEPRNASSDIWSLGCVFLEMSVVLKGLSVEYFKSYFEKNGTGLPFVRTNLPALSMLLTELERTGIPSDSRALVWVKYMLQHDRSARPTAATLVSWITVPDGPYEGNGVFCGICCLSEYGSETSDSLDELGEDPAKN
ncbi:MAG: hypothetical protein M1840_001742 [Geoglossum simile]|nr:MAG: hypothetical protein M1840_001742 [Geoglossum simile]